MVSDHSSGEKIVSDIGTVDTTTVIPANLTIDDVRGVFLSIPSKSSYRKYFKCNEYPVDPISTDVSDIDAFFESHFKGLSVYANKFIFSHTNITKLSRLLGKRHGKIIIGDDRSGPGHTETKRTFDTPGHGWAHPCSSQACGSFMALGIQQSAESNSSEIQILDIRPVAANQQPKLLGFIDRPNIAVNGVGMTKEAGTEGRYIVAAVQDDKLTFYRSQSSNLTKNGQLWTTFDEVLTVDSFKETGAGLVLLTQTDGDIYLMTLDAKDDGSRSKACLYKYENWHDEDSKEHFRLSDRIYEKSLPVTTESDSVSDIEYLIQTAGGIIEGLNKEFGVKILNYRHVLNSSFRWGKGAAATSHSSIELYATDRNVMPLSSIPLFGSDKDFSVLVWKSGMVIPSSGTIVLHEGRQDHSGDGKLWLTSTTDGLKYAEDRQVPKVTMSNGPSGIVFGDDLYIFYQGHRQDGKLRYSVRHDGEWHTDQEVPNTTISESPRAVVFQHKLYVVHQDRAKQLRYNVFDGKHWSRDTTIEIGPMESSPAAVTYKNALYVFHQSPGEGSSSNLWYSLFDDQSERWTQNEAVPDTIMSNDPSAAVFEDKLYVFYQGGGYPGDGAQKSQLWYSTFDGSKWLGPTQVPETGITNGPSAVVANGMLMVYHQGPGNDGQLRCNQFDGIKWLGDKQVPGVDMRSTPSAIYIPET